MRSTARVLSWLPSLAVLLSTGLAQADVAVMPPTATNVEQSEADSIAALLSEAYGAETKERIRGPEELAAVLSDKADPERAAAALGCSEYISTRVIRLDTTYSVSATRHGSGGEVIHAARITAATLDDTEPAVDRLARALDQRIDTRDTRTLDNITKKERRGAQRLKPELVAGIKTSIFWPATQGADLVPHFIVNYDGRHESSNYFVEWGAGFLLPTRDQDGKHQYAGFHLEFGASYYLSQGNVAPYVGGGVLPRILSNGVAVAPYAQVGVMFPRTSSTRIYTDLRVAQHVLAVDPELSDDVLEATGADDVDSLYPTEITFAVGIGF